MTGKWITCDSRVETPIFTKHFSLDRLPKGAEINISALGYFTLLVNGQRVTDRLFTPAQTDYAYRNDLEKQYGMAFNTTYRVLYLTYDIKEFLHTGENKIEVIVGNGYWRQKEIYTEGTYPYSDKLLLCFDLKLDNKIISTDGSEKAYIYPILRSNMFFGEVVDMRMFHQPLKEAEVSVTDFVPDNLTKESCPPERVVKRITPKRIDNSNLYDCGVNITGWIALKVKGNSGDTVTVELAEEIKNGALDHSTYSPPWRKSIHGEPQKQYDVFLLSGETDELRPMFVYHGFRYFTITAPDSVEIIDMSAEVVHNDLEVTTEFNCDNRVLNWLYNAFIRTQLNNSHGSIPSDCPTRERLGYTGDGQICTPAVARIFDARDFYKKWLQDIYDCQDTVSGRIQNTAPFMGGGGGHGGWGSAIVFVPYYCYKAYGDKSFLTESFDKMKHWLKYMLSNCENGILCNIEGGLWNLGDWAATSEKSLEEMLIPVGFVNNCSLIKQLTYMAEISELLGETDKEYFLGLAQEFRASTYREYFRDGHYCAEVQGAEAFAIWAKLPEYQNLYGSLVKRYRELNRFDTGFIGTYVLIEALSESEYRSDAINLLTSDYPDYSFGGMMARNQTTLSEYFCNDRSHDHPMFGAAVVYLFRNLLGIEDTSYIDGKITFSPCFDSVVKSASGSVPTPFGRAKISFKVGETISVNITVPKGLTATLFYNNCTFNLNSGENKFEF